MIANDNDNDAEMIAQAACCERELLAVSWDLAEDHCGKVVTCSLMTTAVLMALSAEVTREEFVSILNATHNAFVSHLEPTYHA